MPDKINGLALGADDYIVNTLEKPFFLASFLPLLKCVDYITKPCRVKIS